MKINRVMGFQLIGDRGVGTTLGPCATCAPPPHRWEVADFRALGHALPQSAGRRHRSPEDRGARDSKIPLEVDRYFAAGALGSAGAAGATGAGVVGSPGVGIDGTGTAGPEVVGVSRSERAGPRWVAISTSATLVGNSAAR